MSLALLRKFSLQRMRTISRYNFANLHRNFSTMRDQGQTTVTVLNKNLENGLMVDSISQMGFRLNNGMVILGPVVIFSTTVLAWNVRDTRDINGESLSLFYLLVPKIDILIIGVGDRGNSLSKPVIEFLRRKKLTLEILPTEQACTTFNFLVSEGRHVAGALIPPETINIRDEDISDTRLQYDKLFRLSEDSWKR